MQLIIYQHNVERFLPLSVVWKSSSSIQKWKRKNIWNVQPRPYGPGCNKYALITSHF